jgi:hypothetical protein
MGVIRTLAGCAFLGEEYIEGSDDNPSHSPSSFGVFGGQEDPAPETSRAVGVGSETSKLRRSVTTTANHCFTSTCCLMRIVPRGGAFLLSARNARLPTLAHDPRLLS